MSKTSLQATKIAQPLAGKQIQNSKGKNIKSPSVCRDGNANPSYHPWEIGSLNNFIQGKQIQCGRKSTYHCNLKTVRWIKGYRNTCPIAGCCGTFNRPAPLILSKFNFAQKAIDKKIKISNVKISYKHHTTGVNVAKGKGSETSNWAGYFPYVDIILYKYDGEAGKEHKIQTIRHNKTVPLAKDSTVSASFTKAISSFNPKKDDLRIEINYSANGAGKYYDKATNPSIIYAKDLKVNIEYEYIEVPKIASMSVSEMQNTIITDPRNPQNDAQEGNCRNTLTHIIKYSNTKPSNIKVSVPNGVKYTMTLNKQDSSITYVYQDTSGKAGEKAITYTLTDTNQKIEKKYIAKLYAKPEINIHNKYIKNQAYHSQDIFITISNSCWNNIKIYVDGNQKLLIENDDFINNGNINQEIFLEKINALSCDKHTLNIHIDDVFYQETVIYVIAPKIVFESDLQGTYSQDKTLEHIPITIRRIDANDLNSPISVTIIDTSNKSTPPATIELYPNESYIQDISVRYPGTFELKYTYNNGCGEESGSFGQYVVTPTHTQSYDNLLIRAEDTSIEYDSIVIRQGDNQKQPITYTGATLINSMRNILLFGKDGLCPLGELGYGILSIKNLNNRTIHNLCIELNPLIESKDEDGYNPLIMEWKTGMLQNFVENFKILNPEFKDIVDIFNIQNQSLINEGTENVVLCIKEIESSINNEFHIIELKIPYSSSYEKEIYMNFLMLGEPTDFIDLDNESSGLYSNQEYYKNADPSESSLFASHTSKQENRGCMCISLKAIDLLSTELSISGDDLDRNDLDNIDDLDIEYNIKLSSKDCDQNTSTVFVDTEIVNDARLIPVAYQINNGEKRALNLQGNTEAISEDGLIRFQRGMMSDTRTMPAQNVFLRYLDVNNNTQFIRATTDNNGIARFQYTIPSYYQDNDDKNASLSTNTKTKYYLPDILNTVDIFYKGDSFHTPAYLAEQKYQTTSTKIDIWGITYKHNNENIFIDINDASISTLSDISDFYIVGQLINQENNQGINNQFVEYHYPYVTTANNLIPINGSATTKENTTTLYGDERQELNGVFEIHIEQPKFSHQISFTDNYANKTREEILNNPNYQDVEVSNSYIEQRGICSRVIDGDTIKVLVSQENDSQEVTVRLVGINTPETNTQGYITSKKFVEKLCLNQEVGLNIDDTKQKDVYGRTLAMVIVENKNLNKILLQEGLAEVMYIPPSEFSPLGEETPANTYNISQIINNGFIEYKGDSSYAKTQNTLLSTTEQPTEATNKNKTTLTYVEDYGTYRRGETVEIAVKLTAKDESKFINRIVISHAIENCGQTVHIFYKPCSTTNTEGFKTIFKTTSSNVIPSQTEAFVYCNVATCLKILARLQKKFVENHNINMLTINAINGYKPNKNVLVKAFIGSEINNQKLGDYLALSAVDIDKEKYSYDQSSDIIYWNIGDMASYETQICNILLEGEHIGDNTIKICGFDYLMPDEEQTITTNISLMRDDSEPEKYYVGDVIRFKASLKADGTNQDIFGQIYFDIQIPEEDYKTTAQAQISTFNDEHFAIGHARLNSTNPIVINATYDGVKMLSITYENSDTYDHNYEENEDNYILGEKALIYDNIYKYDTIVKLRSDQERFVVNENIQIIGSILYNRREIDSEIVYDKYFDSNANIKFFVENQEINNILFSNNEYVINFAVTQPGEYTIRAFIPETNKTEESVDVMTITVENNGENNE